MGPVVCALMLFASPPQELGNELAREVSEAARDQGARRVRVTIGAAEELTGAPAVVEIAAALEASLGSRLAGPGESADLEIEARLTRVRGRVAIGGAVTKDGAAKDWVLVSAEETPEWWAWLAPAGAGSVDARGFAWERAGSLAGEVRDADAGDLDGDGRVEIAAATDDELFVFDVEGSRLVPIARLPLGGGEAAATATRAPRTFVRFVAGTVNEIHVRRTDEKRSRVFGWEGGRVVRRHDRDALVLATRPGGREPLHADLVPGTNAFAEAPKLKRGTSMKPLASSGGPWLDARAADLPPIEQLATTGAAWGLLDAGGTLRLLRADLGEAARVAKCGSAFALADFDGDAKSDALCSGDGPLDAPDRVTLTSEGAVKWSAATTGPIAGIAAGPVESGTAAAVFVRAGGATDVWLLRRGK